jgi:hypothetical protein
MTDNESNTMIAEYKIKTFRWLFYISALQLIVFLAFPLLIYPAQIAFYMEILAILTVGLLFCLYFLIVNIYGLLIDKSRKPVYMILTILMGGWLIWAIVSWLYIEHMDYLLM